MKDRLLRSGKIEDGNGDIGRNKGERKETEKELKLRMEV
jgi:hypothetical protein